MRLGFPNFPSHSQERLFFICFEDQTELDTLLEEILKRAKMAQEKSDAQTDKEKAKADREKFAAATTSYVHWSHESSATTETATATELASNACTTK